MASSKGSENRWSKARYHRILCVWLLFVRADAAFTQQQQHVRSLTISQARACASGSESTVAMLLSSPQLRQQRRRSRSSSLYMSSSSSSSSGSASSSSSRSTPQSTRQTTDTSSSTRPPSRSKPKTRTRPNGASARRKTTTSNKSLREIEQQIVSLGRSGRTDEALDIYHHHISSARVHSIRILNGAIDACARARPTRLAQAFEIFEASDLEPNVFTFGSLMSACSRAGRADKALLLLKNMKPKYNVAPNAVVYSAAISACARSKPARSDTALQLLREVIEDKGLRMSVVGFNAAVSACAQAGDWKNAISILARMEDAAPKNQTRLESLVPAPDVVTYGTVLAACERTEQWGKVLTYSEHMKDRGIPLDGLAISSCLHACQQLGLAQQAMEYLQAMKSVTTTERKTSGWMRSGARKPLIGPDEVAYRLAISACARGGEWEDGVRLLFELEDMTGAPGDVVAYTAAITGCEYAGRWKQAFLLMDRMRKKGVEPNEWTMAAVIGACATACAKENKPEFMLAPQQKAFRLLNVLKKDPSVVNPNIQVYNAAIRVCAEACDLEGAMELYDEVSESELQPTTFTYGSLMTACERVGDIEAASKVFRLLRADGIEPNEIIYGAAISCCRKADESERALRLLKRMINEKLSPNVATFNTVVMAQTDSKKAANLQRAILVYKLMKSEFVAENARPNRQTYNLLIRAFIACKQPAMAETFMRKMREDNMKPDVDMYTATVTAYERVGQPLKALQLMESMQQEGYEYYGVKVLNTAFKNAVKLANVVGRGLSSSEDDSTTMASQLDEYEDDEPDGDYFAGEDTFMGSNKM